MKILLINGPAGSGKDSIAKQLFPNPAKQGVLFEKLALPIKHAIAAMFQLSPDDYQLFFESPEKDKESPLFFNKTPRQVLIAFSEIFAKPQIDHNVFAELFCRRVDWAAKVNPKLRLVVVTDCGFKDELDYIVSKYGSKNVGLARLQREGYTFTNDSRNYITPDSPLDFYVSLDNNGTLEDAATALYNPLKEWANV